MTTIIILLGIWAAGGFAAIGALKGVSTVDGSQISNEVYLQKFSQSWYAFGMVILILLTEIGNHLDKK
jgi:hypothetical protein